MRESRYCGGRVEKEEVGEGGGREEGRLGRREEERGVETLLPNSDRRGLEEE